MDPRSFDRIARALARRQDRRRALRAVALALVAPAFAKPALAQRYPPICGQEGGHCTLWVPCCAGLTCVTLPLNPNSGVCRGAGVNRPRRSGAGISLGEQASFTVEVDCRGRPETTTVTNAGSVPITVQEITSINDPRTDKEPYRRNDEIRPGGSITYESGSGASRNALTRESIYDNNVGDAEGALVTANGATEEARCGATTAQEARSGITTNDRAGARRQRRGGPESSGG